MNANYADRQLSNLTVAFFKLKEFLNEVQYPLSHVKITYDLKQDFYDIEGKLSQEQENEYFPEEVLNSVNYTFKEIISNYLTVYKRVFLNKISIECDLDRLGIIYSSIIIKSRFSLKHGLFDISSNRILRNVFEQTETGIESGFLEQTPTYMELFFKRHDVKTVTFITDFNLGLSNENSILLSSTWWLALQGYIDRYRDKEKIFLPDSSLLFSLVDREHLKVISGKLYPNLILRIDKGKLKEQQLRNVLEQIEYLLTPFNNLSIKQVNIKEIMVGKYKLSFEVEDSNFPSKINLNSLESFTKWNKLFNSILGEEKFKQIERKWTKYSTIVFKQNSTSIEIHSEQFKVSRTFEKYADTKEVLDSIKRVAKKLPEDYKIGCFILNKNKSYLNKTNLLIIPKESDEISEKLAMNRNVLNKSSDGSVEYECALSNSTVFVYQLCFKERIK